MIAVGAASMATWGIALVAVLAVATPVGELARNAAPGGAGVLERRGRTLPLVAVLLAVVAWGVLEAGRVLVLGPVEAAAVRALAGGEPPGRATRSAARDYRRLLPAVLASRALATTLWVPGTVLALAVVLPVSTAIEAAGSALGAPVSRSGAGVGVALFALAGGRRAADVAAGSPVLDLPPGDGSARLGSVVADPVGVARRGALPAALVFLPLPFLAAGTVLALDGSTPAALGVGLLAVAAVTGTFAHSLATVVRVQDAEGDRSGAGPTGGTSSGRAGATGLGRIALAALVLTGAVLAGGYVRAAELRPAGPGHGSPGPVAEGADPGAVADEALAALDRRSHALEVRDESRPRRPNGSVGEWSERRELRGRYDPVRGRKRGTAWYGDTGPTGWYVSDSLVATDPRTDGSEFVWRGADLSPNHPVAASGSYDPFDGSEWLPDEPGPGWRAPNRSDGRIHLVSRDPAAVRAFGDVAEEIEVNGSVRLTVSTRTGYLRRAVVRYTRPSWSGNGSVEVRRTAVVSGYGTTDVERPPGLDRRPLELFFDVLFY